MDGLGGISCSRDRPTAAPRACAKFSSPSDSPSHGETSLGGRRAGTSPSFFGAFGAWCPAGSCRAYVYMYVCFCRHILWRASFPGKASFYEGHRGKERSINMLCPLVRPDGAPTTRRRVIGRRSISDASLGRARPSPPGRVWSFSALILPHDVPYRKEVPLDDPWAVSEMRVGASDGRGSRVRCNPPLSSPQLTHPLWTDRLSRVQTMGNDTKEI